MALQVQEKLHRVTWPLARIPEFRQQIIPEPDVPS